MLIRKEDWISLKCKAISARLVAFGKSNVSDETTDKKITQ